MIKQTLALIMAFQPLLMAETTFCDDRQSCPIISNAPLSIETIVNVVGGAYQAIVVENFMTFVVFLGFVMLILWLILQRSRKSSVAIEVK